MSDPTNPGCTEFSAPNSRPPLNSVTKRRNGEVGYFTRCQNSNCLGSEYYQEGCDTGYVQVGLCGGNGDVGNARTSCGNACPGLGVESCNRTCDSQRRICRRLLRDYTTEKNKNTHPVCCKKNRNDAQAADCPPGYYINSAACNEDNESELAISCLFADNSNVLGVGCHVLALASNSLIRNEYLRQMNEACPYGNNLKSPACISAMEEFPTETFELREYLRTFCRDKENNPEYRDVCACFYKDAFYDDILKQIQEKYFIPSQLLGDARKCYYPPCAGAAIQYDPANKVCPAVNLVNCIQTITVNSSGQIDRLVINQDIQGCGNIRPISQNCPVPCRLPEVCIDGTCQDPDRCTSNASCGKDEDGNPRKCNEGVCENIPKTSKWTYFGIIVLVLAIIVACIWAAKSWWKNRTSSANSVPTTPISS